jgi:hypothetical protein
MTDDRMIRCIGLAAGTQLYIDRMQAAIKAYQHVLDSGCGAPWSALAAHVVLRPEALAIDAKLRACDAMLAEKRKARGEGA